MLKGYDMMDKKFGGGAPKVHSVDNCYTHQAQLFLETAVKALSKPFVVSELRQPCVC